jgi:hypothetical protein
MVDRKLFFGKETFSNKLFRKKFDQKPKGRNNDKLFFQKENFTKETKG